MKRRIHLLHLHCEVKLGADVIQSFHRGYGRGGRIRHVKVDVWLPERKRHDTFMLSPSSTVKFDTSWPNKCNITWINQSLHRIAQEGICPPCCLQVFALYRRCKDETVKTIIARPHYSLKDTFYQWLDEKVPRSLEIHLSLVLHLIETVFKIELKFHLK